MLNISIQLDPTVGNLTMQFDAHMEALGFNRKGIVGATLGAPVVTSPAGMSPGVPVAPVEAVNQDSEPVPAEAAPKRGRKPKTAPEPTVVEQTQETVAQDAVDEAREVAATAPAEATIDDLRDALNGFVAKHGMAKAQSDGADIFEKALGKAPEGEAMWRLSIVAAKGAEFIAKAVAAWKAAT